MDAPPSSAASRPLPRPFLASSPPPPPVAVGFIGSSSTVDSSQLLNRILDSRSFGSDKEFLPGSDMARVRVRYQHDCDKGIVFVRSLQAGNEQEELKAMLFVFSICHIVVFIHDGLKFDTQILKKFRVLQSAKHALLPFLKSQTSPNPNLNASSAPRGGLSSRHQSSPPQFSPIILFVSESNLSSDALISVLSNKKRLISSLESQIRFLVKKLHLSSRVSGNPNFTPLFSLDPSRSVSLVDSSTNQKGEPLNHISNLINSLSSNLINENLSHFTNSEELQIIRDFISRNSEILRGRQSGNSIPGSGLASAAIAAATSASAVKSVPCLNLPNFENFLALSKSILNSLTHESNNDESIEGALRNLERSKGVNEKFSVSWCEKTLPVCIEVYLKDLPKYYRTEMHEKQLKKALEVFYSTVKGSAVEKYAEKLEKECNLIWQNGRQQCDELSLTKRPCIHQKHNNVDNCDNSSNSNGDLVISRHSSGFYFLHACACGRSRALRDDPFEVETGHEAFNAGFKCEKLVPTIKIPSGNLGFWRLVRIGSSKYYDPQKGILQTGFCTKEKFLFPWKIKTEMNKNENEINEKVSESFITKKPFAEVVAGKKENKNENGNLMWIGNNAIPVNTKNTGTKAKTSTREFVTYLGFEHECPYGHRFLLSSQHLNQLDSPVQNQRNNNNSNNSSNKRGSSTKLQLSNNRKQSSDNDEKFGDCDSGEEFSVLARKLPIFMNCPHCVVKSDEREINQKVRFAGKVSQLQRIFIVTPEFPVLLATCPVVQFEDSCLPSSVSNREQESRFGFGSRVLLPPDSFLTLRLPFIYGVKTGSNGDFYPFDPFKTRPDKTAWLVEGSALELVSVGKEA